MNTDIEEFVKPDRYLYQEIAKHLRAQIAEEYRPGDMLVSERSLAAGFAVNQRTVRQALEVLACEGLIARHHRRGAVVLDRNAAGEFALVIASQCLQPDASPYYALTSVAITKLIGEHNRRWIVKCHVGHCDFHDPAYPATLGLMEPDALKRLRGVFSFHSLGDFSSRLRAAKVPLVCLACGEEKGSDVVFDLWSFYGTAFERLKAVGCRRVAAIVIKGWEEFALEEAEKGGVECGRELVYDCVGAEPEQEGYAAFCRMWEQAPHPDGILVGDDMLCRGVLRATTRLGIELPGRLKLISHANRGVAFPYHKEVTRIEFDPVEQARVAVDLMLAKLRDEAGASSTVLLKGKLVEGGTT